MTATCPICQSFDFEYNGPYRGSHPVFLEKQRVCCRNCGLIYANPMPDDCALRKFNANYFTNAHGGNLQNKVSNAFFSGIAQLRIDYINSYLARHKKTVSKILELGPGPGFFASNWLKTHPESTYSAIETDKTCHATLKKFGVRIIDSEDRQIKSESCDLLVMSHVLEHVSSPIHFLSSVTRNLRKGGVVFIEVPCRDWEHKAIDEPHLLFFDKEPMKLLLGKLGFIDIQVTYHGKKILDLQKSPKIASAMMGLRSKLIELGVIAPFSRKRHGMEELTSALERAVLAPYQAHQESLEPAWWLRAVAIQA